MNILVTGGAGFIGSYIVDALVEAGHCVRIFDNLDEQVHQGKTPEYLNPEAEFIKADVRDCDALVDAVEDIDAVFHYAAAVGVSQSQYEIKRYMDVNVGGTANLLDVLVNTKNRVAKLIVPGSMTSYGEGAYECTTCGRVRPELRSVADVAGKCWDPICPKCGGRLATALATLETDRFNCNSFYGITKRDQEQMCALYSKLYGLKTVCLRYFNVYGPRQSLSNPYTGVMSIFISRIKNNNAALVYEDGAQTRDFIYIDDIVRANMLALESGAKGFRTFNIGTGVATPIGEVAEKISSCLGGTRPVEISGQFRKGDTRHCFPDITAASSLLGFTPRVDLEQGIAKLIDWSRDQEAVDMFTKASDELTEKGII